MSRRARAVVLTSIAVGACTTHRTAEDRSPRSESTRSSDGAYTVGLGPLTVAPGEERTVCVVRRLANADPLHVGAMRNELPGAHHLIVYRVGDAEERPTPFDCVPFADTLDPSRGSPMLVSQRTDDRLDLPKGVAFTLEPRQMLRLELHYFNASAEPKALTAMTTMLPAEDYRDEASLLFLGDLDVALAPHRATTLGPVFFPLEDYASAKFFAFTGHEHRLGTNVRLWSATSASDPGTPIYDVPDWTWSEPATVVHDPPVSLAPGGGFKLRCDWMNPGSEAVTFGESATGEMCFFFAYYYPSKGPRVCVRGVETGGSVTCCPGDSVLCKTLRR